MKRSSEQNVYYHVHIKVPLAMYYGVDPNYMHELLLIRFALIEIRDGQYIVESTSGMSKTRFSLFIENIWQFIFQQNIPIDDYKVIDEPVKIKTI